MLEKIFIQWPLLVLYVLACPFMALWWLFTHPWGLMRILFGKSRSQEVVSLHRPFPAPPPPVQRLFAESKARAEAAAEESEPAAEEIIYAQSAPTVEQSIEELPDNLKDLMRKQ